MGRAQSNLIFIYLLIILFVPHAIWANEFVSARPSDVRLKQNIEPLKLGLDQILALRPITYQWRSDTDQFQRFGNRLEIGFVAQEVAPLVPQAVVQIAADPPATRQNPTLNQRLKSTYAIDYAQMIPLLVAGIQALQAENSQLTARLAKLEVTNLPRATPVRVPAAPQQPLALDAPPDATRTDQ